MKKIFIVLAVLSLNVSCSTMDWAGLAQGMSDAYASSYTQQTNQTSYNYQTLEGCIVVAADGTYLGKITQFISADSIFSDTGKYGSSYSTTSIWNENGNYGGQFSIKSPFNSHSVKPPKIYRNNSFVAYLTVNENLGRAINPYALRAYFKQ